MCKLQNYEEHIDMAVVREPVWAYLRQHCNSFATMSANAVFSDTHTLNTVGELTEELKCLFLVQQTNQSICSVCKRVVQGKSVARFTNRKTTNHGSRISKFHHG